MVFFFGLAYFSVSAYSSESHILYRGSPIGANLNGFFNSIYFSFITATTTGFGDITPVGMAKVFSILEVILAMIIFGILMSKIVSVKQEMILEEVYDLSFEERMNRLRGSLSRFKFDVQSHIDSVNSGHANAKALVNDIWINLNALDLAVFDIAKLLMTAGSETKEFTKPVDIYHQLILLGSIKACLSKIQELSSLLNDRGLFWRKEMVVENLEAILVTTIRFVSFLEVRSVDEKVLENLRSIRVLCQGIRLELEKNPPVRRLYASQQKLMEAIKELSSEN